MERLRLTKRGTYRMADLRASIETEDRVRVEREGRGWRFRSWSHDAQSWSEGEHYCKEYDALIAASIHIAAVKRGEYENTCAEDAAAAFRAWQAGTATQPKGGV